MGRQRKLEPAAMEDDALLELEAGGELLVSGSSASSSVDICTNLLERYGTSTAPQHRHLCACACAIRSLITEEGLPLSPASYLTAVLTAIRQADVNDRDEIAALSSFLSILVPLLPARSLPELKAKEAASDVMSLLQSSSKKMAMPTIRSLIGALGVLVLCMDFDDWNTLQSPLEMLFSFAVDRRPKVRRSAQEGLEKAFAAFDTSTVQKKTNALLMSLFKKYVCIDTLNRSQIRSLAKSEHMEALHLLYLLKLIASNIRKKTIQKLLPDIYKLLACQFSMFVRHTLMVLEIFMECLDTSSLASESEKVIATLTSYISNRKNPIDTIISASTLLKNVLNRLHDVNPKLWTDHFPLIFSLLSGFIDSKIETASLLAGILKELVNVHIDKNMFPSDDDLFLNSTVPSSPESRAMEAVCIILEKKLSTCVDFPNEHILAVISDLFLNLGQISYIFMKNILLQLSQRATGIEVSTELNHLQVCLGSAITAIGSERMLSIFPISFDEETSTCSNVWLFPLLKKYVSGGSFPYFIENLMPTATAMMAARKNVEHSASVDDLEACLLQIWDLLPSFCHHTSYSEHYKMLSPLIISTLKEAPSLQKIICMSLKVLVRTIIQKEMPKECDLSSAHDDSSDDKGVVCQPLKKSISKDMKAVASCSMDLIQSFIEVFCSSKPENQAYLKDAVEALALVIGASNLRKIFVTIAEKSNFGDSPREEVAVRGQIDGSEKVANVSSGTKDENTSCLAIEIMSCIISGADKDLMKEIFNYIKPYIVAENRTCTSEAYSTLSKILKEQSWFCYEHADELMEMLLGTRSIHDVNILRSRFSCIEILLAHFVKSKEEAQKKKAFPLLNELILALKDSDAEIRKTAHDSLCAASASLKKTQSDNPEVAVCQLFTMLMGYFYGSSPHIKSGAVAALSLLLYKDADACSYVPNLLSSVLALLKKKETEVIKAVLGFVKVLVCSLRADELTQQLPEIVSSIIPLSSVSKHHFRSKVKFIFEILLRKCGSTSVNEIVPKKYHEFVRSVKDHQCNNTPKEEHESGFDHMKQSSSVERGQKRKHNAVTSDGKHSGNHERKKEKFKKSRKSTVHMNAPTRANRKDNGRVTGVQLNSNRKFQKSFKNTGKGKRMHDRDNKKRRKESTKG